MSLYAHRMLLLYVVNVLIINLKFVWESQNLKKVLWIQKQ